MKRSAASMLSGKKPVQAAVGFVGYIVMCEFLVFEFVHHFLMWGIVFLFPGCY
jgi:hypothetical protein